MTPFPHTPELLAVARRVVWFKEPTDALNDAVHFLAHAMTYGTIEDLQILLRHVGHTTLKEALERAPAGVFDRRSWAWWNTRLGRIPVPPLPVRQLG